MRLGLYLVRDDVGRAVAILDVGIRFLGVLADEAFLLVAVGQPRAQDRLVLLQVDLVGVEVLDHLVQRLDAFLGVTLNAFSDFLNGRAFTDAVGDVGLMDHDGAEMTIEDIRVQVGVFAGADGFQEVGDVVAAAVALELTNFFAVVVVGEAAASVNTVWRI